MILKVEPMRNQFLPNVVQTVLLNTELEPTRTVERMAQRWVNLSYMYFKIHHRQNELIDESIITRKRILVISSCMFYVMPIFEK